MNQGSVSKGKKIKNSESKHTDKPKTDITRDVTGAKLLS
jgi:hypothetical protein